VSGSSIRTYWQHRAIAREHRTAVSLHGHTLHSKEMLAIIPRTIREATFQSWNRKESPGHGRNLDVSRLWWTPPLSPRQAWLVEQEQIETKLGCRALISLTDHDSIEAPLLLRVLREGGETPVSVEWTAPYQSTFFHIGVHNLPPGRSREIMADLEEYTGNPQPRRLAELLETLSGDPRTLIVLNHPLWDEKGIGKRAHAAVAENLIRRHREHIHALELNGFRTQPENSRVEDLAAATGIPVISGGDRHGREPSSNVNLTNASTFEEFVDEIRRDRKSDVLLMPQQRDLPAVRLFRAVSDVLRDDPHHGRGWRRWHDRVFCRCDDGAVRPLSAVWGDGPAPEILSRLVGSIQLLDRALTNSRIKAALRWTYAEDK